MPEPPRTADGDRPAFEGRHLRGRALVLAAAGVIWGAALVVWARHGMDETAILWAAGLDPAGRLIGLARAASAYGMPIMGMILLAGLVASVRLDSWRPLRSVFLLTLLSLALSGAAGDLLKEVVDRPRPHVQYPALSLAAPESTTWSFPSGHSTKAVALALPALLFVPGWRGGRGLLKAVLATLALAVCASRVVLGAHFPSDVLGGVAMALSGLPVAVLATHRLLERTTASALDRASRIWIGVYVVVVVVLLKLS